MLIRHARVTFFKYRTCQCSDQPCFQVVATTARRGRWTWQSRCPVTTTRSTRGCLSATLPVSWPCSPTGHRAAPAWPADSWSSWYKRAEHATGVCSSFNRSLWISVKTCHMFSPVFLGDNGNHINSKKKIIFSCYFSFHHWSVVHRHVLISINFISSNYGSDMTTVI